jgi:polar amino acid transport system substrate-binding protein
MKKLTAILLALTMILSLASFAAAEGIETIDPGKLTISTSPDFQPFEYTDDNGNIVGIEPDMMKLICEKIGLELVIDAMDFDSALLAAQQGKSDAVVSGVTVTEDRKLVYDFTNTYITITQGIVSKEANNVTMDTLKDQTIGVQRGTTGHIYAVDDFGEDHTLAYDKYSLAFQALMNGQVDCILVDDLVGKAYAKRIPGLEVVESTYEPESFGFGFAKDKYPALLADFNEALQALIDDGTVESIILKWNE